MAKIESTFDTNTKSFNVTIDGSKVSNVKEFSVFADKVTDFTGKEEEVFMVRVASREDTDEGKTSKRDVTTFVSQDSTEAKAALDGGYGVKLSNGLVEIKTTSNKLDRELEQQVADYFSEK